MCAGSTKIAAPTVILKMAAASPRMPMTRRRPGSLAAGTGVLMPPKVQGLDEAAIPRSRSFARACALAQDDNATRVLYKRVWGKKKPVLGQIFPGGVTTFDQADLPQPLPALDLLLARNGVPDVCKLLEVDEPGDAIFAGEPRDEASFVFVHAPRQVIRYPGIEHPRATGHDVDVVGAHDPTGLSIGPAPPSSFFRRVGQFFSPSPSLFSPSFTKATRLSS